jgi:type III pantothenate kinase
MRLLIDIGNSCVKWATLQDDGKLGPQQRVCYQKNNMGKIIDAITIHYPQEVWISNVAGPQIVATLTDWLTANWGLTPTLVETAEHDCGVTNGYHLPKQLGIDRWLALIAAHDLAVGNLCVIDCGTAVTLDVLSETGHHLGGLIMPGTTTMYNALLKDTYALAPQIGFAKSSSLHFESILAYDTQAGIVLGTLYAVIGWVEYILNRFKQEGKELTLILTGGNSFEIIRLLSSPCLHIPDLVLQGLAVMIKSRDIE